MSAVLEISDLRHAYAGKQVLDHISVRLQQQEIVGLLGLNGAGKSTLLKLLAGVLPRNIEQIKLPSDSDSGQHAVGYLAERPMFYPELSVDENIAFTARLNGVPKHKLTQRLTEVKRDCQLEKFDNKLAGNLSKGYQQRLGLAMAIAHEPQLLLLDEPTDGLDPAQMTETHALIRRLANNCCILLSSHRLDEIRQLCSRFLILDQGKLQFDSDNATQAEPLQQVAEIFNHITGAGNT
ncbi:MAG: ABC transporter ATP-binding protein [Chromatiales bacterium]|jgi:ABC-2 type transport system ATP-binding protein